MAPSSTVSSLGNIYPQFLQDPNFISPPKDVIALGLDRCTHNLYLVPLTELMHSSGLNPKMLPLSHIRHNRCVCLTARLILNFHNKSTEIGIVPICVQMKPISLFESGVAGERWVPSMYLLLHNVLNFISSLQTNLMPRPRVSYDSHVITQLFTTHKLILRWQVCARLITWHWMYD